jgi:hypothetical protein
MAITIEQAIKGQKIYWKGYIGTIDCPSNDVIKTLRDQNRMSTDTVLKLGDAHWVVIQLSTSNATELLAVRQLVNLENLTLISSFDSAKRSEIDDLVSKLRNICS